MNELKGRALGNLVDPATGRIDPVRIADYIGVSGTDITAIINRASRGHHPNPESPFHQEPLRTLITILEGLSALTGNSQRDAVTWLNTSHPELDDHSPLDLLKEGNIDVVADLVEDILDGEPA